MSQKIFDVRFERVKPNGLRSRTVAEVAKITDQLRAWQRGDAGAEEALFASVYQALKRLASALLRRERAGHPYSSGDLVHEAFLRVYRTSDIEWQSRAHFFGIVVRVMRRILVEVGRAQAAGKRGGGRKRVTFGEHLEITSELDVDLLALDRALEALGEHAPEQLRAVEYRFIAGFTTEECADVFQVSPATVNRNCKDGKEWLQQHLNSELPA
jgi:RNA polymerase sigma factor (TIGR02999 family)